MRCGIYYPIIGSDREHQPDVPVNNHVSEQERSGDSHGEERPEHHSPGVLYLFDLVLLDADTECAFPFGGYLLAYRAAERRFVGQTLPGCFVQELPLDISCSAGNAAYDNIAAALLDVAYVLVELLLIPVEGNLADTFGDFGFRFLVAEFLDDAVYRAEHYSNEQRREYAVAKQQRGSEHELEVPSAHSSDEHQDKEHDSDNSKGYQTLIPGREHLWSPGNEERRDAKYADCYAAPVRNLEMVDVYSAEHYQHGEKDTCDREFPGESVHKVGSEVGYRADRLHYHVAGGNLRAAETAFSAQDYPAENREHVVPFQAVSTGETVRRLGDYGLLERSAVYYHIQEAADNGAENEYKYPGHDV